MSDQRPETITADMIVYRDPSTERTAIALERIADALEKQNAGTDEEFRQRVIAALHQGIPTTIVNHGLLPDTVIAGGSTKCDKKLTYIKPDGIATGNK